MNTSVPMRRYDGAGYGSDAETEAPQIPVIKVRRKSSGSSPGNEEAPQDGVSTTIQSEGFRACIASNELTLLTPITTATSIPSTTSKQIISNESFKAPIPEVFTNRKLALGDFPENIDRIRSFESKGPSPAQTIVRRHSWMSDLHHQVEEDVVCLGGQHRTHAPFLGETIQKPGRLSEGDASDATVGNGVLGKHDNRGSMSPRPTNTTRNKRKSRATAKQIDTNRLAKSSNRMVSASSTNTVIRVGNCFTDNLFTKHKSRPEKKGKQRTSVRSCAPLGNATFSFPSNDRVIQLPAPDLPPANTLTGCSKQSLNLDVLKRHERAEFECLREEHPRDDELTQFATQLPTLDQLQGYETFDEFNADIERHDSEEVGFFKKVVQAIGVYFCCFITSDRKSKAKKYDSGRRAPPLFEEGTEYSSGGGRVSNGERRARMREYGTIIERNFSEPAPAKLSIGLSIPGGNCRDKANKSTTTPGNDRLEGKIRPAKDDDVPSRWVYHPAYEVDTEDPGDYAYISEGSAPDATSIWRGHVRHRELVAAQEQREETRQLRRAREKSRERQHRGRLQRNRKRVVSEATFSESILSVSTVPILVGEHSNRSGNEYGENADSEFDGGDEADTTYTRDSATHAESIIGATSDESEDWESGSAGSGWSFPYSVNSQQVHISTHAAPAAPSRDIYSTISALGSFCSSYIARPISRRPSSIYNTVTKPCLSTTLAPNGGTIFPAGKYGEGHGYLVQELRSVLRSSANTCRGSSNKNKSIYPEGLPEGSMSSRTTSYGSYLASTSGGARECFETNIKDFGSTSTSSPLLPPVGARKNSGQPFSVIEADTSIETYMHRKPPAVYRPASESLRSAKGKLNLEKIMEQAEVRAKVKRECKAGREKLQGLYPGVIDGKKQALEKDFNEEDESDVEEVVQNSH